MSACGLLRRRDSLGSRRSTRRAAVHVALCARGRPGRFAVVAQTPSAQFPTVRVAAVQATPVTLDAEATVDKAIGLVDAAADDGAALVVFPECFVSLYPSGAWAAAAATWTDGCDELWERLWASSLDARGPEVARLTAACARRGIHIAIGVNEREDERPGTLYNSLLLIGPE